MNENERKSRAAAPPLRLTLRRVEKTGRYTMGRLMVDGTPACDTLEPRSRGLTKASTAAEIAAAKALGTTAVPAGRYRVRMRPSARFGRMMPFLEDVPGYEGVLIHPGNSPADTRGCILPGTRGRGGTLLDSRAAADALCEAVRRAEAEGRGATIDIIA